MAYILFRNIAAAAAGLAITSLWSGCGKEEVQVYQVSKEKPAAQPGQAASEHPSQPHAHWKLPEGWEELPPGQLRIAHFQIKATNSQPAQVTVIPLPGRSGSDLDNLNRWRAQVGLPPVTAEELPALSETVEIAGGKGQLFDLVGGPSGQEGKTRILAAILRQDEIAWFFKMTGPDALVAGEKAKFKELLKGFALHAGAPGQGLPGADVPFGELPPNHPPVGNTTQELPANHPPIGSAAMPDVKAGTNANLKAPAHWKQTSPGALQAAKYTISDPQAGQAEVTVATMAGDGGGQTANINRWRGQLGLPPVSEAEAQKLATTIDAGKAKATVVDLRSADQKRAMVAASVAADNRTAFYKLMGDAAVVEREKAAFLQMIQSAQ